MRPPRQTDERAEGTAVAPTLAVVTEPARARRLADALSFRALEPLPGDASPAYTPAPWPSVAALVEAARTRAPEVALVDARRVLSEHAALLELRAIAPELVLVGLVPAAEPGAGTPEVPAEIAALFDDVLLDDAIDATSVLFRVAWATSRRRATRAREDERRMRIAHASHELRTPLNTMLGVVELLGDAPTAPAAPETTPSSSLRWLAALKRAGELLLVRASELVESAGGTRTTPRLPAAPASEPAAAPDEGLSESLASLAAAAPAGRGGRARVLLVDDASEGRELLAAWFAEGPLALETEADGERALERALATPYDAILLDLQLVGRDGFTIARELGRRELALGRVATPLVAFSGDDRPESIARSAASGFVRHLAKPIQRQALVRALTDVLGEAARERDALALLVARTEVPAEALPLLAGYLANRRVDAERLRVALEREDHATLARIGHNVLGTGGSYGVPALSDIGGELEDAAHARDLARAVRLVARYESVVASVGRWLGEGALTGLQEGRPMKHPSGTRQKVERRDAPLGKRNA